MEGDIAMQVRYNGDYEPAQYADISDFVSHEITNAAWGCENTAKAVMRSLEILVERLALKGVLDSEDVKEISQTLYENVYLMG
jgi:hypothetical protein